MTTIIVMTQAELDDALATHGADRDAEIIISSPEDVWLKVHTTVSASITATDSTNVTVYGSASVTAHNSASVHVHGSARVVAFDSASVHVTGSN